MKKYTEEYLRSLQEIDNGPTDESPLFELAEQELGKGHVAYLVGNDHGIMDCYVEALLEVEI